MSRATLAPVGCLAAVIGLLTPAARADEPAPRTPNILFIIVDEMRWNVMGCAGHPLVKTPNLDRLARESTRFETAYTVAPICSPSRYSLFTSRYAHVHGVTSNGPHPRDGQVMLTTLLKHHGYETAIAGKLHFTPDWEDYDFDYFWSNSNEGPGKLETYPRFIQRKYGRPADRQPDPGSLLYPTDPLGGDIGKLTIPKEDYPTYWLTDRTVEFLRERRSKDKAFFMYVSYKEPHSPYRMPEPYWSMYDPKDIPAPKIPEQVKKERAEAIKQKHKGPMRHLIDDEEMARVLTAKYLGHVTNVDDNVGRLLKELEDLGLAKDTMIVFTADHGNMLGDLGRWFKGVMYEGSSRIPLMIKAPPGCKYAEHFNRGKVVKEIVENIDVMPTLCEMIGVPLPTEGIQGKSLTGLTAATEKNWKNRAFAQRTTMMVRTPQYKLIKDERKARRGGGEGAYELYDLTKDPKEETDLAADPQYKAVVVDLAKLIGDWQKDVPPPAKFAGIEPPAFAYTTAEDLKRMESKGRRRNRDGDE
jgi:arylsulfatase A-like enzyme